MGDAPFPPWMLSIPPEKIEMESMSDRQCNAMQCNAKGLLYSVHLLCAPCTLYLTSSQEIGVPVPRVLVV